MASCFRGVLLLTVVTTGSAVWSAGNMASVDDRSSSPDREPAVMDGPGQPNGSAASDGLFEDWNPQNDYPPEAQQSDWTPAMTPLWTAMFTVDYRVQTMFDSHTTFQFGTQPGPGSYAPLSKLAWSLDSTWQGLKVGVEKPTWEVSVEWLTPMVRGIYGQMVDSDWSGPNRDVASLQESSERWLDGQQLELAASFKMSDCGLALPFEIWPTIGFRFQRFSMMAYDGLQVVNDGTMGELPGGATVAPAGSRWQEDSISFNQQYYMSYFGGQVRTTWKVLDDRPVALVFQADLAGAWAYNIDHHIGGYEAAGIHSYCMDSTTGGALHLSLSAEMPVVKRFSIGLQVDHLEIRTTGLHRDYLTGKENSDETWSNGDSVTSDQTSLTACVRGRF
jgi:hypothetical protein